MADVPGREAFAPSAAPPEGEVIFTVSGVRAGIKRSLPVALSIFAYGLIFGVLARQANFSLAEAALMSTMVFAGASQFVVVGMWAAPLPVAAIIFTTLVVNLRHVLMGVSLQPWFSRLSALKAYGSVFFLTDETWALTMGELTKGKRDAAFLLGSGLITFVAWVSTTAVGYLAGTALQNPRQWGLDFAFTAVFIALLSGLWRSKRDLLPWVVAALVAVAASVWLPGKWYILLGGIAGSVVGAWRSGR